MSDSLAPGELITPSIRLARLLGRGGMGSVWIADHLRLRTQVVVKFIAAEFVENDEAMARFEREATLAAQAKSPHVVQVFDHGISNGGLPYIAMEYLEGEDLAKRIARRRAIPLALWANWMTQACRGLSRAHAKGIVHRDIKPENIFLCDNEGEVLVKVLDFGIAKTLTAAGGFSGTATGAFLGTPYYMSPEQTMGQKEIDHRTDLWSLGVVAYFALTGVRPFEHEALGAIVAAITTLPIAPPSQHNPTLSPSVDAWMARALARVPDQRFGSAKEMADEFALAIGQAPRESTVSLPAPSWGPAPSTPQKHTTMSSSVQTRTLSGSATGAPRSIGKALWIGGAALVLSGALAVIVALRSAPRSDGVPSNGASGLVVTNATPAPVSPVLTEPPAATPPPALAASTVVGPAALIAPPTMTVTATTSPPESKPFARPNPGHAPGKLATPGKPAAPAPVRTPATLPPARDPMKMHIE